MNVIPSTALTVVLPLQFFYDLSHSPSQLKPRSIFCAESALCITYITRTPHHTYAHTYERIYIHLIDLR